jgi:predicted ATPase
MADVGIAESIRHLVARQSGRLSAEERQTLEAASVAGMEFSAAAVAAAAKTGEEHHTIAQAVQQKLAA